VFRSIQSNTAITFDYQIKKTIPPQMSNTALTQSLDAAAGAIEAGMNTMVAANLVLNLVL